MSLFEQPITVQHFQATSQWQLCCLAVSQWQCSFTLAVLSLVCFQVTITQKLLNENWFFLQNHTSDIKTYIYFLFRKIWKISCKYPFKVLCKPLSWLLIGPFDIARLRPIARFVCAKMPDSPNCWAYSLRRISKPVNTYLTPISQIIFKNNFKIFLGIWNLVLNIMWWCKNYSEAWYVWYVFTALDILLIVRPAGRLVWHLCIETPPTRRDL